MTTALDLLRKRVQEEGPVPDSKGDRPFAAVAVIINPNDRDGSLLLIRRVERLGDPWSGQIAFPGGHRAREDRDYLETALREAREEMGIDLRRHVLLGHLPIVQAHTRRIHVVPYVFELRTSAVIRTNEEVSENFWAPLDSLEKIRATKSEVRAENRNLLVDAYVYDGRVIWGLTFRIINILLGKII